jgi:polysaccharide export outer membrane protein
MTARVLLVLACSALLAQQPASYPGANPQFQTRHPRYQIEAGDVIDLQFLPTTEYNQTVTVQPDGFIT